MTRGMRNNNPFNIKISASRWKGKLSKSQNTDGIFEQFVSLNYGLRAGVILLRNYHLKHEIFSLRKYIDRFAPISENQTDSYYKFVYDHIDRNKSYIYRLSNGDFSVTFGSLFQSDEYFWLMCQAICMYESNIYIQIDKFKSAYGILSR